MLLYTPGAGPRDRSRAHGGAELVREPLVSNRSVSSGAFLLVVDLPEAETVDALQLVLELLLRAGSIEDAVELPALAAATAPDSSFIRMFMPTIERLPTSTRPSGREK